MPRVGQNPNRSQKAHTFEPIVFAVVTHLPNEYGYHAQRFDVIQNSIRSMVGKARLPHSLLIWDNGSCHEFREWLRYDLRPDVLVLSKNVGKTSARTALFRMVPPDSVVCYSDDDILYYDNWLQPQLELLNHFPNVAAVSGYPVRTAFRWGIDHTLRWARHNAVVETGHFISTEWEDDFAVSIGRDIEYHRQYTAHDVDYRVTYRGKQAYLTAHHCQFIARAKTIDQVLKFDGQAMGDERVFDVALDDLGLRLCTTERMCRHIGNVTDEKIRSELCLQV